MWAAGIESRYIANLVKSGEIVRLSRDLFVRRADAPHGWLEYAVACKISGGVIWGPTAGQIHELTDDIPRAIHVLVPEGKRIKPYTVGIVVSARSTRLRRNLEIWS